MTSRTLRLVKDDSNEQPSSHDNTGRDRRVHRRHDLEQQGIAVERYDDRRDAATLGRLKDISAGGVRIEAEGAENIKPDHQIRVRLQLPTYAGISPFIQTDGNEVKPKREWIGWLAVARVRHIDGNRAEIAGRLVDMEEMDRGMLGLYLSTQPLAA